MSVDDSLTNNDAAIDWLVRHRTEFDLLLTHSSKIPDTEKLKIQKIINSATLSKTHGSLQGEDSLEFFLVAFKRSYWIETNLLQNFLSSAIKNFATTERGQYLLSGVRSPIFMVRHIDTKSYKDPEETLRKTVALVARVKQGLENFYDFVKTW